MINLCVTKCEVELRIWEDQDQALDKDRIRILVQPSRICCFQSCGDVTLLIQKIKGGGGEGEEYKNSEGGTNIKEFFLLKNYLRKDQIFKSH